jgi:hypothetical protein
MEKACLLQHADSENNQEIANRNYLAEITAAVTVWAKTTGSSARGCSCRTNQ